MLLGGLLVAQETPAPPLTMDAYIREALENNPDLAAQRLTIGVAQTREMTARLRPNPVLTLSGQTLNLLGATYTSATPLGPNQFNVHTEFPLERGGKRQERIAVARQDRGLAETGVQEVARQVVAAVQNAFVDVQQAAEDLNLAQENLRSLERVVAINEARQRAGDLSQVELERSRVAALQYRTAVQQAELALDLAKSQLWRLLGRRQPAGALAIDGAMRRDAVLEGLEELVDKALKKRPDYVLSQQAQARSRADLRLQLAQRKVDFSVGTEFTRQAAWGISGNSIGLYLSVPLPVFNRNQGEIARAQREIGLAEAQTRALEAAIRTEVEQAYRQYRVTRTLLEGIESNMLARARGVRDTTEYSYKRGEASLVEYLDAQRAFNDAMKAFNDARADYARSLYRIETVTGTTMADR